MPRFPGFIGPSNQLSSVNADAQRTVNLYLERIESGAGKEGEQWALIGTEGLRTLLTLPTLPVRGVFTASDGTAYAVGGNKLYSLSSSWVASELGTLNTSTGPVSMDDNGTYLICVDGSRFGYTYNLTSATFAQITDEDFPGATQVTYQDSYFLFTGLNGEEFGFVDDDELDFDALDFSSAAGSPDDMVGILSDLQNVYMFGEKTTEVFYNCGDAADPFIRTQGAIIPVGCMAAFSIQPLQGAVYWLGQSDKGAGIVYRAKGLSPERISTHPLESIIRGLIADGQDMSTARAWAYEQGGHAFYCINLPGAETTWVYDLATEEWHERAYLLNGDYSRHRADCHAYAHGTNIVGDYESGKIYALDPEAYTDAGNPIVRERITPVVSKNLKLITHHALEIDMEAGVGLTGTGQGTDPQAMLQFSDDSGHTWSNERWTDIGEIGKRKTRAIFRRLGTARNRVYRFRISDPVKVTILGAEINPEEGVA